MIGQFSQIATFAESTALTVSLVYFYGVFARWNRTMGTHHILMGILFGFAVILAINNPIQMSEGVIIDMRNLFIGLAMGLMGWVAGLITLAVAVVLRLSVGGIGAFAGLTAMVLAAAFALIWRIYIDKRLESRWLSLGVLGLMLSTHMIAAFTLPPALRNQILFEIGPLLTTCNVLGAILLGGMIHREELLVLEADKLRTDARTDPLTQLHNRRHFIDVFSRLSPPRPASMGRAVICFDIDHFKHINDTHGHAAGDVVLRTLSERVSACLRVPDHFGRIGGDEFVIALPSVDRATAYAVAERCRFVIDKTPIPIGTEMQHVTISLGVYWGQGAPDFEAELRMADDALYDAKRRGRNCIGFRPADPDTASPLKPAA